MEKDLLDRRNIYSSMYLKRRFRMIGFAAAGGFRK